NAGTSPPGESEMRKFQDLARSFSFMQKREPNLELDTMHEVYFMNPRSVESTPRQQRKNFVPPPLEHPPPIPAHATAATTTTTAASQKNNNSRAAGYSNADVLRQRSVDNGLLLAQAAAASKDKNSHRKQRSFDLSWNKQPPPRSDSSPSPNSPTMTTSIFSP